MANKKDTKKRIDATIKTTPANVVDVFVDYAVQEQIKAADVPPRKRLDISFSDASKIGDTKIDTNQEAYEKAHGKLYNMTHNNTIPWRNYVVYLVIITMLSCCVTFSKYITTATSEDSVSVAKFSYTITDKDLGTPVNLVYSITLTDNTVKEYKFEVKNDSEVAVKLTPSYTPSIGTDAIRFAVKDSSNNNSFFTSRDFAIGETKMVYMVVDPSKFNDGDYNITLTFKVDQK